MFCFGVFCPHFTDEGSPLHRRLRLKPPAINKVTEPRLSRAVNKELPFSALLPCVRPAEPHVIPVEAWRPFEFSASDVIKSVNLLPSTFITLSASFLILLLPQPFSPFLIHAAPYSMSIRLHHLSHLQTPAPPRFSSTVLWVAKYFTFSSPGNHWNIFLCFSALWQVFSLR